MANSKSISIIFPIVGNMKDEDISLYLQSILAQEHERIEIIFVSNTYRKNISNISDVFIYKTKYTWQNYQNLHTAYNIGIKLAQGEFLAFIDLDRLWLPDKLTLQMAAFEDYPQLDGVFGYIHARANARLEDNLELKCQWINIPGYLAGTMLIRHESWKKVGKFTDRFADWYGAAVNSGLLLMMLPIIVAQTQTEVRLSRSDR